MVLDYGIKGDCLSKYSYLLLLALLVKVIVKEIVEIKVRVKVRLGGERGKFREYLHGSQGGQRRKSKGTDIWEFVGMTKLCLAPTS